MPAKKYKYPKKVISKKYKSKSKKSVVKKTTYVNRSSPKLQLPFPLKFYTPLRCGISGYVAPTLNASNLISYLFCIPGNSIYQPFAGLASLPAPATYISVVTGQTALATVQCTGYSQLATIYSNYKVKGSSIKVKINGQAAVDDLIISVAPMAYNVATTLGVVGTFNATVPGIPSLGNMPYAKKQLVNALVENRNSQVSSYCTTAQANGLSKLQYDASIINGVSIANQTNTTAGAQLEDLPWVWVIGIENAYNTAFSYKQAVDIDITYYAELAGSTSPNV